LGDFKDLKVWQQAHSLTLEVYRHTRGFPPAERYGLTSQMRRSAASVAANIAESRGRVGHPDQRRFLHIAQGSAREFESHLLLSLDLGLIAPEPGQELLRRVSAVQRMLSALIHKKL